MPADRPNILIIYPDQWRADALGCVGSQIVRTPHLDRLAGEGMLFTHAFAADPVCTPSRASFMTGRYPHATGVIHNECPLPNDEICFAESLTKAGYRTAYIGKWHLDGESRPGFVPTERRHGWQYWAAHNCGHRYYDGAYFRDTPEALSAPGFEPDHQTDLAIDFLEDAAARPDQPFCLLLAWGPPHTPLEPPEPYRSAYDPASLSLPASVPNDLADRSRKERALYYALCTALDDNLGRLLGALDRLGLSEDTLILFTSDHGDSLGEHGLFRKTTPYDEATRVPCIVRWPGHVPAGVTSGAFCLSVDIAPTLLALCGVSAPAQMQGRDLRRAIVEGSEGPRQDVYDVYMEGHVGYGNPSWWKGQAPTHRMPDEWRALRTRDYLMAADLTGSPVLLFDLRTDPLTTENLAGRSEAQDLQDELLARLLTEARVLDDQALIGQQRV